MKDLMITAYSGFSTVSGETNLTTVITNIRNGAYFHTVRKVEQQLRLGDLSKANAIKKQLPFFTLTGNYSALRQPYSLLRYNPVITVDVDELADDRVDAVRRLLEADADVVACFLTPKRHGFKIFLYLRTAYARRLRKMTFSVPFITYEELENHHALMYEAARLYVERLIGLPVDVSGKDIGRGFFASFDAQAFCFARHASFIASTNKRQCLQDIDGNRRFLPSSVLSVDYRRPVNYQGVYSQAMSLLDSGFRYWYEGDEIDGLNTHNERHRMKDPVEENLFVFFRRPLAEDLSVQWKPASAILTHLTIYGKVQVNRQTQQELVQALEKYGFATRTNGQGSTEYEVVKFQSDEVERNFRQ